MSTVRPPTEPARPSDQPSSGPTSGELLQLALTALLGIATSTDLPGIPASWLCSAVILLILTASTGCWIVADENRTRRAERLLRAARGARRDE